MKYILLKYLNNLSRFFILETIITALFLFVFLSTTLYSVNVFLNDYIFKAMNIQVIVYGDINDVNGHEDSIETLDKIKKKYQEMFDALSANNIKIISENYLITSMIYAGENILDENEYNIIYFDEPTPIFYEDKVNHLIGISRNIESNRHYNSLFYSEFDNSREFVRLGLGGGGLKTLPVIINASSDISDIVLGDSILLEGRMFNEYEIENGEDVVILNNNTYIFTRDGFKEVEVGDEIPLTIDVNNNPQTSYYKVIGLVSGLNSSLSTLSTFHIDESGIYNYYNIPITHNFYITNNNYNKLKNNFNDAIVRNNIMLTKDSNGLYEDDVAFYSQFGGIRPVLIEIYNQNELEEILNTVSFYTSQMNEITQRFSPYSFITNIDNIIPVISSINTNNKIFVVMLIVSIIVAITVIVNIVLNDIENDKKYIGIKISLGSNLKMVLGSKMFEYIILFTIPLILSLLVVPFANSYYINNLKNNTLNFETIYKYNLNIFDSVNYSIILSLILLLIVLVITLVCFVTFYKLKKLKIKEIIIVGDSI